MTPRIGVLSFATRLVATNGAIEMMMPSQSVGLKLFTWFSDRAPAATPPLLSHPWSPEPTSRGLLLYVPEPAYESPDPSLVHDNSQLSSATTFVVNAKGEPLPDVVALPSEVESYCVLLPPEYAVAKISEYEFGLKEATTLFVPLAGFARK